MIKNKKLMDKNRELNVYEKKLRQNNYTFEETIREFKCLCDVLVSIEKSKDSISKFAPKILKSIANVFLYPDTIAVRLKFRGIEYKTDNFEETKWSQSLPLKIENKVEGFLEIVHLKKMPGKGKGAFLKKEKDLIHLIVSIVEKSILRLHYKMEKEIAFKRLGLSEQEQVAINQQLRATEQQLRVQNQQLRDSNQQLISGAKEIKKEKTFTESIINTAQAIIIVLDKNGKIVTYNPYMEKISGYKLKEVKGKDWFTNFLPKCDYNKIRKIFKESIKDIKMVNNVNSILTKKGKEISIEWHTKTLKNDDGSILGIITVGQDVTERKRAEKALIQSESQLQEAQELAHLGHWILDVKTGDVQWSDEVFKIFRLNKKKFKPQIDSVMKLSPWPEENKRDKEIIQKAIENHKTDYYEQKFLRPDGSIGYYFSSFKGIYDDNNNLTIITGTVQDITERKLAAEAEKTLNQQLRATEQQLRASNQQLTASEQQLRVQNQQLRATEQQLRASNQQLTATEQQLRVQNQQLLAKEEQLIVYGKELKKAKGFTERIISTAQSVILVLDKKGKIITFNPYMEKLTGYKLKEMKGKDWFTNFLPKCDYNKVRKVFKASIKDINVVGNVNSIITKKGEERLIEWHDRTLKDENDNAIGVISIGQDITERKIAEKEREQLDSQLLQSQKMESIGVLAGGVAHDFNNILTAIIGDTDLLLQEKEIRNKFGVELESIKKSSDRAADLVKQLLIFCRRDLIKMKETNLNKVINDSMKMIKRLIGEQINIKLNIGKEKIFINGDEGNLNQVLLNLAINARDAMPGGGSLLISSKKVNLTREDVKHFDNIEPGDYIKVSVEDTGKGVKKEIQDKIFEPFLHLKA